MTPWQSDTSANLSRLLLESGKRPKPLKRAAVRGAPRYIARHGLLHAITDRHPVHGRRELRYVTDEELAALGLVAQQCQPCSASSYGSRSAFLPRPPPPGSSAHLSASPVSRKLAVRSGESGAAAASGEGGGSAAGPSSGREATISSAPVADLLRRPTPVAHCATWAPRIPTATRLTRSMTPSSQNSSKTRQAGCCSLPATSACIRARCDWRISPCCLGRRKRGAN